MNISKELMAASVTPLVLSLLSQDDQYGYGLIRRMRELSQGHLDWSEGMVYQVLHRLQRQGWAESRPVVLKNGVGRKYYRLTRTGHQTLKNQLQQWVLIYLTLGKINPKLGNPT